MQDTRNQSLSKVDKKFYELKNNKKGLLSGVPKSMPPISKAYRVQDKASSVGFDWEKVDEVFDKIKEEIHELDTALNNKNKNQKRGGVSLIYQLFTSFCSCSALSLGFKWFEGCERGGRLHLNKKILCPVTLP